MHKIYGQICNIISYYIIYVNRNFLKTIVSLQIANMWPKEINRFCPFVFFHGNQMEEKTTFLVIYFLFLSPPVFPNTLLVPENSFFNFFVKKFLLKNTCTLKIFYKVKKIQKKKRNFKKFVHKIKN